MTKLGAWRRRSVLGLCGLGVAGLARAQARKPDELLMGGTGTGMAPLRRLFEDLGRPVRFVPNLGSGGGIKALSAGAIDVALSARRISEAERAAGLVERELFHTPFVWAVHAAVPKLRTTLEELVEIYAARLERWSDGQAIRLILRPESDSDSKLLKSLHPGLAQALAMAEKRPGLKLAITDDESLADIERIGGALGTTSLAMAAAVGGSARVLELAGVAPSVQALASGRYPYRKTVYMVTRGDPKGAASATMRALAGPASADALARLGCLSVYQG